MGVYIRLVDYNSQNEKEKAFLQAISNSGSKDLYSVSSDNFSKIPGLPIAYWISQKVVKAFETGSRLKEIGDTRQGMATSDNNRFLRLWYEISNQNFYLYAKSADEAKIFNKKWIPYNKGGNFRKWYGNIDYLINYANDGQEVKQLASSMYGSYTRTIKSISEYFKKCLSWSKISSGSIAFRYYPDGFIFDVAGCCIFFKDDNKMNLYFGFLNSKISATILRAISPTLNFEAGHIASLPIIHTDVQKALIVNETVVKNVFHCKKDWDQYETSWDFKKSPLI
jgi:hypothetical protein